MKFTTLGSTGLVVSRMAFGAMTFGIDSGINFFNTADAYAGGDSERMLAKALGKKRRDVVITTKVGFRTGDAIVHQGLSRHHILESLHESLSRLDTDYIDVYIVHRLDPLTPLQETLETLDDVVRAGKVRYVGFSNWPAWLAAKAVGLQLGRGWTQFRAAELYYSLVGRDVEHELVPLLEDSGIGMLVWSPLASGFLSGKYTRSNPQGDGGRLTGFDILPVDKERGYDLIDVMGDIARAHNASVAAVALAWLLTRPAVASILVGATKLSQLADNLRAVDLDLTPAELEKLNDMTRPADIYPNWFNRNINDEKVRAALANSQARP